MMHQPHRSPLWTVFVAAAWRLSQAQAFVACPWCKLARSFRGTRAADASWSVWCSYNQVGQWNWNTHGSDWIYQGGPDSSEVKNMPYFNQWEDMDDSPVSWHITEARRVNAKIALHCVLWIFDVDTDWSAATARPPP